ncbi:MAG: DUF6378 domain-containing protein [bacterium]
MSTTTPIDETLKDRDSKYGTFGIQASFAQSLKAIMRSHANWYKMPPDAREALDHIQVKISRILNGDPSMHDHWHDIIGYARLVEQRIEEASDPLAKFERKVPANMPVDPEEEPTGPNPNDALGG